MKYANSSPRALPGTTGKRGISSAHVDTQKARVSATEPAKTVGKARCPTELVDARPQLTHQVLNNLAGEHGRVERNTDVRDVARLVNMMVTWLPQLIEAARQTIPGETLAEVHIPGFVPKGSLNSREHHFARTKRVKREHLIVASALRVGARELAGAWREVGRVVITRNSVGKPDSDQAVGYCKGTRDAVAKFLGIDDGSDAVKWESVAQRCKRDAAGLVIRFEGKK